jgi:dipeptidyl aminopeptidase/acylaminoacyl peptidase
MPRSPQSFCRIGCYCVFGITFPLAATAQLESGPSFDPNPVEIPEISKTAPRPVAAMDLLTLRDLHGIQISPDGKHVAFVVGQAVYESNSYRSGLFVVGTQTGSKPISLGTAGAPHWDYINQWLSETPQWSPDSKTIYYRLNNAGVWQVWEWKLRGGAPLQVTHTGHSVHSFQLSSDGTQLAVVVERPNTGDRQQLAEHGILYDGTLDVGAATPILDQVLKMRGGDIETTETWMHDLRTGNERRATEKEVETYASWREDGSKYVSSGKTFSAKEIEEQHITGVKISGDATKVVYQRWMSDPVESARWSFPLFLKSMNGGPAIDLTPGVYAIDQYWWTSDSREVYYTQNDGDGHPEKLMRITVAGGTARQVLIPTDLLSEYSVDHSGRVAACRLENSTTPARVAIADLSTGKIRTLVDVNPELKNLRLSPAHRMDFSNKYGDHFWGHLVLPSDYEHGRRRYPLIITLYRDGGNFLRGGVGDEYPIQVLAANGFAILNFDIGIFRNNKPGDFETAALELQSPIEGMAAAVDKLMNMGIIDPARVGVTGFSFGAALVAYSISHIDLFRAAIESGGGGQDPDLYFLGNDRNRAYLLNRLGLGPPEGESAARWRMISASLNARYIVSPLLINASDSEYLLDMPLVTTLRDSSKPIELFVYANQLHEKNPPTHRYEIYERNLDWFKFWLEGLEDPNPEKAEQYRRWEKLCDMQVASNPSQPMFCVGTKH